MIQTILTHLGTLRDGPLKRRRLLTVLAPLTLLGLVICICMGPAPVDEDVYLLIDSQETYTVTADSDLDYQSDALYTGSNNAGAADVQLILPKGQEVQLTAVEEGTSAAVKNSGTEVKLLSASLGGSAEDDTVDTGVVTTRHETVANLLRRSHVKVADDEMVVVDLTADTPSITVCRQYTRLRNVQVQTDFAEERIADPLMAKGTEEIITPGVPGTVTQTYMDVFVKGKLERTEFISTTEDNSVTQVVEYGTLVDSVADGDELVSVYRNDDGSGYLLFASGDTMTFSSQVTCNASAYAIHGRTASGRPTQYGNIAVDPSVFPYGTRFYIYTDDGYLTYGMATAADCGTSIKGHKLDLWFDEYDQACRFGRRNCTVFVLN
jgi:3D (Asp-Asp-Asp) domain-containing protein